MSSLYDKPPPKTKPPDKISLSEREFEALSAFLQKEKWVVWKDEKALKAFFRPADGGGMKFAFFSKRKGVWFTSDINSRLAVQTWDISRREEENTPYAIPLSAEALSEGDLDDD